MAFVEGTRLIQLNSKVSNSIEASPCPQSRVLFLESGGNGRALSHDLQSRVSKTAGNGLSAEAAARRLDWRSDRNWLDWERPEGQLASDL